MAPPTPFSVTHSGITLAVATDGRRITRIRLNTPGDRAPEGPFELLAARELAEYLAGQRIEFTVSVAATGTPFQETVWTELQRIPYGETCSYGTVARRIGQPGASRAVGSANNANPIPIIIPCHRVVAADGSLGGFAGGVELKRSLLAIEARRLIDLPPDRSYLLSVQ